MDFWLCTTAISPTRGQWLKAFCVNIFPFFGTDSGLALLRRVANIALHFALAHFHDLDLGPQSHQMVWKSLHCAVPFPISLAG